MNFIAILHIHHHTIIHNLNNLIKVMLTKKKQSGTHLKFLKYL